MICPGFSQQELEDNVRALDRNLRFGASTAGNCRNISLRHITQSEGQAVFLQFPDKSFIQCVYAEADVLSDVLSTLP